MARFGTKHAGPGCPSHRNASNCALRAQATPVTAFTPTSSSSNQTFAGDNATTASLAPSPLAVAGSNSSFGSVGALDDELREGSDAASRYLGRVEGLVVQADLGNPAAAWTLLTLAFAGGDYNGSTLVLDGRVDFGAAGDMERAVVGGTGRFRRARGYSLMTKFGNPTPNTGVFEMDVYVTTMA
ncbi:pterocarpan synthase 1-like [Oryza glaberrima]|uniref:pterocarpan synthase 1-like n=1 Tax=Oryza glaberrima TaxID=4538 RepID=UPI00224C3EF8|nr:pterocarpan synthase 1-like [Oryza glaberrima]